MKLPIHWLKDFVGVKDPPQKLAEKLTLAGLEVGKIEKLGHDTILDLEVTPNRADCLSILGLGREVAGIYGQTLPNPSKTKFKSLRQLLKTHPLDPKQVGLKIKDKETCPRMIVAKFDGIVIRPSPSFLQERLSSYGIKPINNVVDITNAIMVELGQPLHAFDAAKLRGNTIVVRRATKIENIKTIDGKERELDEETLVLADEGGPIDIAGIQGGEASSISSETSSIVLTVSQFNPSLIRRASKKFHFQTESSYRFERGLDQTVFEIAFLRAIDLLQAHASGILKGVDWIDTHPWSPTLLHGTPSRLRDLIGLQESILPDARIAKILKGWGFEITKGKKRWSVLVPSWRRDIMMWVDLVEEIARALDYNELPKTAVLGEIRPPAKNSLIQAKEELRDVLASAGFDEILNYSFYGDQDVKVFSLRIENHLHLLNPISPDQMVMRGSLLPQVLRAAGENLKNFPEVKLFELGTVFSKNQEGLPKEELKLAACASGKQSLDTISGTLRFVLKHFGIEEDKIQMKPEAIEEGGQGTEAEIFINGVSIGVLGIFSQSVLQKTKIKKPVAFLYISPVTLLQFKKDPLYKPISLYPTIERDIAIVLDQTYVFRDVEETIKKQSSLPMTVELFDTFTDEKRFGKGKWSMAFHLIFQHQERTLTSDEVEAILQRIRKELEGKFGAQIR